MSWLETLRTGIEACAPTGCVPPDLLGILIGIAGVIFAVGLGEGARVSTRRSTRSAPMF